MKKCYVLVIGIIVLLGCAHSQKYIGWEYVRIEKKVPNDNCEYKIQEVCGRPDADCYHWYKKRATMFDANTVVLEDVSKERISSGSAIMIDGIGSAGYSSSVRTTMVADYYHCPPKE
ncbi:hypothetical protein MNBD_UNCLBAC01-39 [hydrothermal vent metagenome]|uniref:DUF4156 domain-containing protein n=1 Tax=hydrothermal vent metagenome TaxID=652676 RepID=A0A3B1CXH4_9ZZZZ